MYGLAIKIVAYISSICVEAPLGQICMKLCTMGSFTDVINHAKFYLNRVSSFDSVAGQIFGFPIGKRKSPGLELPFSL